MILSGKIFPSRQADSSVYNDSPLADFRAEDRAVWRPARRARRFHEYRVRDRLRQSDVEEGRGEIRRKERDKAVPERCYFAYSSTKTRLNEYSIFGLA